MDWPLTRMVAEREAKEGVSSLFSFLGMALSCRVVGWLFCWEGWNLVGWLSDCFVLVGHLADGTQLIGCDAWLLLTSLVW